MLSLSIEEGLFKSLRLASIYMLPEGLLISKIPLSNRNRDYEEEQVLN